MKKIGLAICFLLAQIFLPCAFADEIIDSNGTIVPCRIETVSGGLIEYKKDGNLYCFQREKDSPVFNDYIDVRDKLYKRHSIERYTGKIILKDSEGVRIRNQNGDMAIPWYRVKFVGIYKP